MLCSGRIGSRRDDSEKRVNLAQYVGLTLKSVFNAYSDLRDLCSSSVLHLGEPSECASTEGDVKTILSCCQSRNACVNISVPVKSLAKCSAFPHSEPQTSSARPPRAERCLKICEEILRGVAASGAGIRFWADNNQVGPIAPTSRTTTEPERPSGKQPGGETL